MQSQLQAAQIGYSEHLQLLANTILVIGYRRASPTASITRPAASLTATSPRAADRSELIAPPRTMIPAGAPSAASQRGKRSSSGRMSASPIGSVPMAAIRITLATSSRRPARVNRVGSNAIPASPIRTNTLDGTAMKPTVLDKMNSRTTRFASIAFKWEN